MEIFTSRNKKIIKSIFNLEATQQKLSRKAVLTRRRTVDLRKRKAKKNQRKVQKKS